MSQKMTKKQQFQRGRNVLVRCRSCGKLTHSNLDGYMGLDLCRPCREDAENENDHLDNHDPSHPVTSCKWCEKVTQQLTTGKASV